MPLEVRDPCRHLPADAKGALSGLRGECSPCRRENRKFTLINEVANERLREAGRRWACLNPWQEVYLLPDGRVYYCCETVSKLAFEELESMGEYPRESVSQIWCGEAFHSLRRDLIVNKLDRWPACASCGIWMAHVCETHQENGVRKTQNMITEILEKLD